jgi:hypothetical protein
MIKEAEPIVNYKKPELLLIVNFSLQEIDFLSSFLANYYPDDNMPYATSISVDIQKKLSDAKLIIQKFKLLHGIKDE